MSKRELAALRRDAEERDADAREQLRRKLEPDCIYCNRSPPCRCVCFLSFDAAMAAAALARAAQSTGKKGHYQWEGMDYTTLKEKFGGTEKGCAFVEVVPDID